MRIKTLIHPLKATQFNPQQSVLHIFIIIISMLGDTSA